MSMNARNAVALVISILITTVTLVACSEKSPSDLNSAAALLPAMPCDPAAGKCRLDEACVRDADCVTLACAEGRCILPTCEDLRHDGDETGIDCGGSTCKQCDGEPCVTDEQCGSGACNALLSKCADASRTDGKRSPSLGETDVDCGGATADSTGSPPARCLSGKACKVSADCDSGFCTNRICEMRRLGRQDGDESDVDCGGTVDPDTSHPEPRCADDKRCNDDDDCASGACNTNTKRCVAGRSCKARVGSSAAGIDTCGAREVNDGAREHESCCRSLPLPSSREWRLDKYEITAGRMRRFVESVGPNVRKWATGEIEANTVAGKRLAAQIPAAFRNLLPASGDTREPLNIHVQLGAIAMDGSVPSDSQGCYNGAGAYGHNTYWLSETTLREYYGASFPARRFMQAQYDEKSVNCTPYWMLAAFCAWDGGRLPTEGEMREAWGGAAYPWGGAFGTNVAEGLPVAPAAGVAHEDTVNWKNGALLFYHYPDFGDGLDTVGYIAAPGRFPKDRTSVTSRGESWMDLGANMLEMVQVQSASGPDDFCDSSVVAAGETANCKVGTPNAGVRRAAGVPNVKWVGGSWEGHGISFTPHVVPMQAQYGKTGARCARPNY